MRGPIIIRDLVSKEKLRVIYGSLWCAGKDRKLQNDNTTEDLKRQSKNYRSKELSVLSFGSAFDYLN